MENTNKDLHGRITFTYLILFLMKLSVEWCAILIFILRLGKIFITCFDYYPGRTYFSLKLYNIQLSVWRLKNYVK
jgi:hypothetical protein